MTIKQYKRLRKSYKKMRAIWAKSSDPCRDEALKAFDDSIMEIDAEIQELLIADELSGYTAYLEDVI